MRLQRQRKAHGRGRRRDAPQAKGTRRGRARANPTFQGRGGRVITSSPLASQPVQGRRGQDGAAGVRTGESRAGGASWGRFLPVSDNWISLFPWAPPRRFSSRRHLSAPCTQKKSSLTCSPLYSLLQTARPVWQTLPRTGEGKFRRDSLSGAAAAAGSWQEAWGRDGGCRSLGGPAPQRIRARPLTPHSRKPSLTQEARCQVGCASAAGLLCFKK